MARAYKVCVLGGEEETYGTETKERSSEDIGRQTNLLKGNKN